MTAANAFARDDGAWLFFDTAIYDDDGFVRSLRSKVVACDRLRLAIGACGRVPRGWDGKISEWLHAQGSQADALENAPALIAGLMAFDPLALNRAPLWRRLIWKTTGPVVKPGIRLAFAWWNEDASRGETAIITSDDEFGAAYPPMELHPINTITSPRPAFGEWFDWHDDLGMGLDFQPERDGRALGEMQRREPQPGGCRVGGMFERYHIHATGIDRAVIVTWPDRIGRPIKVAG